MSTQYYEIVKGKYNEDIARAKAKLAPYDLLKRIENIESQLAQFNAWRNNTADPTMAKNLNKIKSLIDKFENQVVPGINQNANNVKTIYNDINTKIVPSLNQNAANVQTIFNRISKDILPNIELNAANVQQIFNEIKTKIVPIINEARASAIEAVGKARAAAQDALSVVNRLKISALGLKNDTLTMARAADELRKVMLTEMQRISRAFLEFGSDVWDSVKNIFTEAIDVKNAVVQSVKEIAVPMRQSIAHIKELEKKEVYLNPFLIAGNLLYAFGYLTFLPYGGQWSVMIEFLQGFIRTSKQLLELGSEIKIFGAKLSAAPDKISSAIYTAVINVNKGIRTFISKFRNITENLSERLKGSAESVVKSLADARFKAELEEFQLEDSDFVQSLTAHYDLAKKKLDLINKEEKRVESLTLSSITDINNSEKNFVNTILGKYVEPELSKEEIERRAEAQKRIDEVAKTEKELKQQAAETDNIDEKVELNRAARESAIEKENLEKEEAAKRAIAAAEAEKKKKEANEKAAQAAAEAEAIRKARVEAEKKRAEEERAKAEAETKRKAEEQRKKEEAAAKKAAEEAAIQAARAEAARQARIQAQAEAKAQAQAEAKAQAKAEAAAAARAEAARQAAIEARSSKLR